MATVAKILVNYHHHRTGQSPAIRPVSLAMWVPVPGRRGSWVKPCRSFKSEESTCEKDRENGNLKDNNNGLESKRGIYRTIDVLKSAFLRNSSSEEKFSEKLEESLSSVSSFKFPFGC